MDYSICIVAVSLLLAGSQAKAPTSKIWTPLAEKDMHLVVKGSVPEGVKQIAFFRCDLEALRKEIDRAPQDTEPDWETKRRAIALPVPGGETRTFLWHRVAPTSPRLSSLTQANYVHIRGVDPSDTSVIADGFMVRTGLEIRITSKKSKCMLTRVSKETSNVYACYVIPKPLKSESGAL